MLSQLDVIVDNPTIQPCVRANAAEIAKRVLIQSMVWRSGKPNTNIRKTAIFIFSKIISGGMIDPGTLHKLFPDILAPLKNCLDDDWDADLRQSATRFIKLVIEKLRDELDQIELSGLYQVLLTRLDDARDQIRIDTTNALKAFFSCKNVDEAQPRPTCRTPPSSTCARRCSYTWTTRMRRSRRQSSTAWSSRERLNLRSS